MTGLPNAKYILPVGKNLVTHEVICEVIDIGELASKHNYKNFLPPSQHTH